MEEQDELNAACKEWLEATRRTERGFTSPYWQVIDLRHACEKAEAAGLFDIPRGDQHGTPGT